MKLWGGLNMVQYMDELFLEYEAELEAKSKAYLASPQCAIDDASPIISASTEFCEFVGRKQALVIAARMAAKSKLENERRQAWEDSLTPEQWNQHFGEEDSEQ